MSVCLKSLFCGKDTFLKRNFSKKCMVVLKNTSLCAIVKDEIMNPAGGILDFVESTVPFVEEAVIVDTGSMDGTREVLEECRIKYEHLKVCDRPFDNYASSRNFSLAHATKKWSLILDADERLVETDFVTLAKEQEMYGKEVRGYNIPVYNIYSSGNHVLIRGLNPRLFFKAGARFHRVMWEKVVFSSARVKLDCRKSLASIKHFLHEKEAEIEKMNEWYSTWPVDIAVSDRGGFRPFRFDSPRDCPSYSSWKEFNPRRNKYR